MDHTRPVLLLLVVLRLLHETSACGRSSRSSPPRDTTSPVFSHCPQDIHEIAEPIQENAKVTWTEPTAYDNWENRNVTVRRSGRRPGTLFSERWSPYTIHYTARDRSGNSASCSFKIYVSVVRCSELSSPSDGWKICHPGVDLRPRYGSVCRFGCYPGHELRGASSTTCREDGSWSIAETPYCEKLTCSRDVMYPSAQELDILSISCTDSNKYRSKCTFSCTDGYSVRVGQSKVLVCGATGNWVGTRPVCEDSRPPSFTDCPAVVTGYAERSKTTGRNYWTDPKATDNSESVTVVHTSGPKSGDELPVGEYDIIYTATDDSGNNATCEFRVVIKQIQCPEIFPLPYTSVTCPSGRIYGARCDFACNNDTASSVSMETYCEKYGARYYYGLWDFGDNQPYCTREIPCIDLAAPANGALACDIWEAGRYCRMLCQQGYTVDTAPGTNVHKGMLICGNSGEWRPSSVIPDCVETDTRRGSTAVVEIPFGYYTGQCADAIAEIRQKFIANFINFTGSCTPPQCSVGNVQVTCGSTTKRDVDALVTVKLTVDIAGDATYAEVISIRDGFKSDLVAARERGDLDIGLGDQTLAAGPPEFGETEVICTDGSVPSTVKHTCVKCGPGSYQNSDVCSKCPIGQYQTDLGQTSCTPCMSGTTTETVGSTSSTACKEACPKGHYSSKGIPPCSACDLGKYADAKGSRECKFCPGSKTTNRTGSTTVDACYDFDVMFTSMPEDEMEAPSVIADMTSVEEFRLTMWLRCSECVKMLNITADTGDAMLLLTGGTDKLKTTVGSTNFPAVTLTLRSTLWHHIRVDWFSQTVTVYVDGTEVVTGSHTETLPEKIHVAFGGQNFIGSVSQLSMTSSVTEDTGGPGETCLTQDGGEPDLLSWRQYADIDGPFFKTRSKCDVFDNCVSAPCQNDGACSDVIDDFTCACAAGFSGKDCSVNIDDCEGSVCDNDGTCVDGVDGYTCTCPHGFTGEFCEIQVVDGAWGAWGNWSVCNVSCGTGHQERQRTCSNPEPSNGGNTCPGDDTDVRECHEEPCVFECDTDPPEIEHGSLNCDWEDEGRTSRRCAPTCDTGYDFDSDQNVVPPNLRCGPSTGGEWNIRSDENNDLLLPSCLEKMPGNANILYYKARYDLDTADEQTKAAIKDIVTARARQTDCVSRLGRCHVQGVDVTIEDGDRRKRATSYVTFTLTIKCDINTDINECYDLLATVVQELDSFISSQGYTITVNGENYDVIENSMSLDGTTICEAGYVPVFQYCIPCGTGMYQSGDFCERCGFGYYQDEIAQSSCKQCPEGWTTQNLMTRNASLCNVQKSTTSSSSTSTTTTTTQSTTTSTTSTTPTSTTSLKTTTTSSTSSATFSTTSTKPSTTTMTLSMTSTTTSLSTSTKQSTRTSTTSANLPSTMSTTQSPTTATQSLNDGELVIVIVIVIVVVTVLCALTVGIGVCIRKHRAERATIAKSTPDLHGSTSDMHDEPTPFYKVPPTSSFIGKPESLPSRKSFAVTVSDMGFDKDPFNEIPNRYGYDYYYPNYIPEIK